MDPEVKRSIRFYWSQAMNTAQISKVLKKRGYKVPEWEVHKEIGRMREFRHALKQKEKAND